ncbi:hypothetical protein AgCh_031431 [Apium graveolens]
MESKLKLEFNGLAVENLKLKVKFKAQVRGQSLNWVLKNGVEVKLQRNALSVLEYPTGNEVDEEFDFDSSSTNIGERENDVLKNGVEVKLQRNALSVLEHPTGNEVDEEFDFDSSSSTNIGERENDVCDFGKSITTPVFCEDYVMLDYRLGLSTGMVAFFNNLAVENIAGFKLLLTSNLMLENRYVMAFVTFVGGNVAPATCVTVLCAYIAPAAARSGKPEFLADVYSTFSSSDRIPIFCDNTSAIAITENPVQHSRTKHIDIKYHFIREHVMNGTVELHFVPSEKQLADIFTKPLDESTFSRLVSELVKFMSQTGYIYEKNNFSALVNKKIQQFGDYHNMMDFVKNCKLNYAILESPTIYCEVVEEMWTTAVYNSTDKTISFTLKDSDIVNMLNSMGYALTTSKLSEIRRLYTRFFMMFANHLIENIEIENPTNKLNCWVQERRIIADLNRANHHKEVLLFYFPVMERPQEDKKGEGQSENERSPKNEVREVSVSQPSHTAVSQQTAVLKKDLSSLLVVSSQKDVTIEQSYHPRAQAKRVRDKRSPQTYIRKKKSKPLGMHRAHT